MPFSLDLSDKPPSRPKSITKRFPVLLPIAVFVILLVGYSLVERGIRPPLIGVIPIEGVILESELTIKKLRVFESNPQVKGIIVRINSPGGAVAPSQEIFSELTRLKDKTKIYASISSVGASGGYYIAVGAEKIFANPGSLTGSIGVIMQTFNVEKLMDHLGVRSEVIKSGTNKDIGSSFRRMEPEERKLLETVIQDTHRQFITAIAENRPIHREEIETLADGRPFTGKQALDHGLIDGLGSFRETVEAMRLDLGITEKVELIYATDTKEALLSVLDFGSFFKFKKTFTHTGLFYLGSSLFEP